MRQGLRGAALVMAVWGSVALAETQSTTEVQTPPDSSSSVVTTPGESDVVYTEPGERRTSSSMEQSRVPPPAEEPITTSEEKSTTVVVNPPAAAPSAAVLPPPPEKKQNKPDMRGLTVLLGGGVEGYTGSFAPGIRPGPSWGVSAALKPSNVFGIELGYSGAVNELRAGGDRGTAIGADLVRNGGQAVATLGLTATGFQPYVLAGIGVNKYDVRGDGNAAGYRSDVSGNVPLGAGLRGHLGHFTADARFGYNVLFDNDLVTVPSTTIAGQDTSVNSGGRYQGMVSVGSTF
ncbi:MAG: hypothetical protein ACT4TC_26510 [Myxococcaceae bacterium]